MTDICKHCKKMVFHVGYFCDEFGAPVKQECHMICFTSGNSEIDRAETLREVVEELWGYSDE